MIVRLHGTVLRSALHQLNMSASKSAHTAAIIVIGDEILKGFTTDSNSHFLCKRLFQIGVKVERISVVPDCVDTIAEEVKRCSAAYTHVLTSGGVGPTHDDVTFEGVAKAMDDRVETNAELAEVIEKFFGKQESNNTPAMKLANIPSKAQLIWGIHKRTGEKSKYPIVWIENVTILPGVPKLLERAFDMIEDRFKNPAGGFFHNDIYVTTDEVSIADCLTNFANQYKNVLHLGSYPSFTSSYYKVKLTLDSTDKDLLEEAHKKLMDSLPRGSIAQYDEQPEVDSVKKFNAFLETLSSENALFRKKIEDSSSVIEEAFEKYEWQEISIAFNGGKDCTTLLHLVHIAMMKKFGEKCDRKLKAIYLQPKTPFEKVEQFAKDICERYPIELLVSKGNIKEALVDMKNAHPEIKAVFMGTRMADPSAVRIKTWAKTDPGWPELMRISPLIDWTYKETWKFLRSLSIRYCSLYDRGFTSLGNRDNTHPNPALKYVDSHGVTKYRPAYLLDDESLEREGRTKNGP